MSWFGFGKKGLSSPASSSSDATGNNNNSNSNQLSEMEMKRQLFTAYVEDISAGQRREIADRIDKVNYLTHNSVRHVLYSEAFSLTVIYGYGMVYANRNFLRTFEDKIKPLPLALFMGLIIYNVFFNLREMAMRTKLTGIIQDYEFFLKVNKCHHVEAGMAQLAWLQFVEDHLKNLKEGELDTDKMREVSITRSSGSSSNNNSGNAVPSINDLKKQLLIK